MQTCIASDTTETPLSEAKKQQILADFREHDIAEKAYLEAREKRDRYSIKVENKRTSPEEACKEAEDKQWCIKKTIKSYAEKDRYERQRAMGRYLVLVTYTNDGAFTLKMSGGNYIGELDAPTVKKREQIILEHYLGNGFEPFEPRVSIVKTEYVGIDIFLNPDELSHYLSDGRLNYIATPADKQIINQP